MDVKKCPELCGVILLQYDFGRYVLYFELLQKNLSSEKFLPKLSLCFLLLIPALPPRHNPNQRKQLTIFINEGDNENSQTIVIVKKLQSG